MSTLAPQHVSPTSTPYASTRAPGAASSDAVFGAVVCPWLDLADKAGDDVWMRHALLHTGYAHAFRSLVGHPGVPAQEQGAAEVRARENEDRARMYVELVGWRGYADFVRRHAPGLRPL